MMFLQKRSQSSVLGTLTDWHAIDCDAVHKAAVTMVVINRLVPGGTIVPYCDIARLPAYTALEFRLFAMVIKHLENSLRFLTAKLLDMRGENGIYVEPPAAAQWMGYDNGVRCFLGSSV